MGDRTPSDQQRLAKLVAVKKAEGPILNVVEDPKLDPLIGKRVLKAFDVGDFIGDICFRHVARTEDYSDVLETLYKVIYEDNDMEDMTKEDASRFVSRFNSKYPESAQAKAASGQSIKKRKAVTQPENDRNKLKQPRKLQNIDTSKERMNERIKIQNSNNMKTQGRVSQSEKKQNSKNVSTQISMSQPKKKQNNKSTSAPISMSQSEKKQSSKSKPTQFSESQSGKKHSSRTMSKNISESKSGKKVQPFLISEPKVEMVLASFTMRKHEWRKILRSRRTFYIERGERVGPHARPMLHMSSETMAEKEVRYMVKWSDLSFLHISFETKKVSFSSQCPC